MQLKTKFSVQEHYQRSKRSAHFDLRILDPKKKTLWSWAFPKAKFPNHGEKVLAIRTPNHKLSYMYFEGKLNNGDVVSLYDKGECEVLVFKHNIVVIYFSGEKLKGAYNFIKLFSTKDSWLVTQSTKYSEQSNDKLTAKRNSNKRKHSA